VVDLSRCRQWKVELGEAGIDVDESPRARLAMMSLPSIGTESAVLRE
jgi:hypothetical protein